MQQIAESGQTKNHLEGKCTIKKRQLRGTKRMLMDGGRPHCTPPLDLSLQGSHNNLFCRAYVPLGQHQEMRLWLQPFFEAFWLTEKTIENAQRRIFYCLFNQSKASKNVCNQSLSFLGDHYTTHASI